MISLRVTHYPTKEPQVNPADRFAVANWTSLSNWWLDPVYSNWANIPMSTKMCDTGDTFSRGRNLKVSKDMWGFVRKINNNDGYRYTRLVGMLIINRSFIDENGVIHLSPGDTGENPPDPQAMAEPIIYPVNVYKIIDETKTHYRIDAFVVDDTDWKNLDHTKYNWEKTPWLIPKMCAEKARTMTIQNVMNGIDSFWLTLSQRSGAWIPKNELALPPDPTKYVINGQRGIGYRVRGSNWYMGLSDGSQVLVRQVTKAQGVKEFYNWRLNARSVVPPSWF